MLDLVVASSGRKLGKTLVAQSIIVGLARAGVRVSFAKMRRHAGRALRISSGEGRAGSDTERCLEAGADRSVLVDYDDAAAALRARSSITGDADMAVWETTSLAGDLSPDLIIYIDDGSGGKSPELRQKADLLVEGPLNPVQASRIASTAMALLGALEDGFAIRGKHWIELQGKPVLGSGRARLLKAVDLEGSILGAAKATGIPYKRAWTHLKEAERSLGARLIIPVRGGAGGGGTRLSPLGRRLLRAYQKAENKLVTQLKGVEV